ncbi:MAG: YgeY family selenium metabolism-linked hydrolase [Spirochaetia bacterium]|nr:YgeY family selenium metabolism-linked hydrolase [Spirochaetia bacterium]
MNGKRRQELLQLTTKLIQTPSITGTEATIVELVKKEMLNHHFDEVFIDAVGNIIGKINGNGNGSTLLFDGHLDTVAIANRDSWTTEPFGGEIKDGNIYGRGSSDMKGALAAMIIAASEAKRLGLNKGDIYVSGTIFEEIAEGYTLESVITQTNPSVVIIGEATELKLNIGQRGRAEILLKTTGVPAHSSHPEVGVNAVYHMMRLVQEIQRLERNIHPALGRGDYVLTDIISSPYPGASVVPETCFATFDRRLLIDETIDSVLLPLQKIIEKLHSQDGTFNAEVTVAKMKIDTYTGHSSTHKKFAPAWLMEKENIHVRKAIDALREAFQKEPEIGTYSFCTNGSSSCGKLKIPTIGYGPSKESLAHIRDEYIEIEQLEKAYTGYLALMNGMG